jgi:threonyl-tRNA synthetase
VTCEPQHHQNHPSADDPTYYVVTAEEVVPLTRYPADRLCTGLRSLIEQEVRGRRTERLPDRLRGLLQRFGFEWEPLSEPGHMRFLGYAAFMFERTRELADSLATSAFEALDIPLVKIEGVSLIDPSAPVVGDYLGMTSSEALYGDSPYEVGGPGHTYMLRQTGCFQKFSACLEHVLMSSALPAAIFEVSDSFRLEPEDVLQCSYRLRRFHLPEAHVHTRTVADAVEISLALHDQIMSVPTGLEADLVLLISATHSFATAHSAYLKHLAARTGAPALLKVSPPGQPCEDGVEVDVEYKIVDSLGCCRELSTFQIDTLITKTFGLRCDNGATPATIHLVMTGGIERYLFLTLDRIVRFEARGARRHLPLWITPVQVRVAVASPASAQYATFIASELGGMGIRTELDDRRFPLEDAAGDADSLLVPYLAVADASQAHDRPAINVRDFNSGVFRVRTVPDLVAEIEKASGSPQRPAGVRRLSRTPFCP